MFSKGVSCGGHSFGPYRANVYEKLMILIVMIMVMARPPASKSEKIETHYVHEEINPWPIPRSALKVRIRVRDSYLGLGIRV